MAPRGVIAAKGEHVGVVCGEDDQRVFGGGQVEGSLNRVVQHSDLLQRTTPIIVMVGVVYPPG